MARPSKERIKAWCIDSASDEPGACREATTTLIYQPWDSDIRPKNSGRYRVYLDRGYAQDHYAYWAQWDGDPDPTVIDNTIKQFGGEKMIFIGTEQEWHDRLTVLTGARVHRDPKGEMYREHENREIAAAWEENQRRKQQIATEEKRVAETLKDLGEKKRKCCVIQ